MASDGGIKDSNQQKDAIKYHDGQIVSAHMCEW